MLTVIIAPEEFIDKYEKYNIFAEKLFREYEIALCKCDYNADCLQEMTPDLYDNIANCEEWRAVILAPDRRDCFNPFDYTGYSENHPRRVNREYLKKRRTERFLNYEKAAENPLIKLSSAFCGSSYSKLLLQDEEYEALISGAETEYSVLLARRLRDINSKVEAFRLRNSRNQRLFNLLGKSEEKYTKAVDAIETRDCTALMSMLDDDVKVLELNRILGNEDSRYTDPEIVDEEICNYKKYLILSELESRFTLLDKPPAEVRCVALRCCDTETYHNKINHKPSSQSVYSAFAGNNLYHPTISFFAYDIMSREDKRYDTELLNFLLCLLVFSANEIPRGSVSGGYLYRLECSFIRDGIMQICQNYLNKLYATHSAIEIKIGDLSRERKQEIDDFTAEQAFETPVVVPVSIRSSRSRDSLKAKVRPGLSKDCPEDEKSLWKNQFKTINKNFIKYLREPRRAVKTAVKGPLRENNTVVDDRIRSLTEYQLEDVVYKEQEEERQMVETATSHLFDTEAYTKSINDAKEQIDDRIEKRMTKRKTTAVSLIAVLVYLIGFIPFLITESSNATTIVTAVVLASLCTVIFIASALVVLFVFRYQLKKLFREFNEVIERICCEIDKSLAAFSDYISHACNVMRKFSIIYYDNNPENDLITIMTKHKLDIEKLIRMIVDKYFLYIDLNNIDNSAEPFSYDFSKPVDYEYLPESGDRKSCKAEFITRNNHIILPVDYLDSIIAVKEDLYD